MATYTSTQTGLWNDSATWGGGGYPDTADDIANVRHKVEYNITDSGSPFLGDVNIQWSSNNYTGHLAHQTGTYLNLNGRLNVIGGIYEMADDVVVAFTGNNSPDHGVYIYNTDRTTFYAKGTTPVAETYMTSSGDVGDFYLPVNDASSFETGDWVSVFFRYNDLKSKEDFFNEVNYPKGVLQGEGVLNTGQYGNDIYTSNTDRFHNESAHLTDEGFVIHDISSNNIYLRDLVGPDSEITKAAGSKITVSNSKVFREIQRVILGTGSKRTTSRISSINYRTHEITLEDSLTSTDVVGEKVYLSALKIHKHKNSIVRTVGNQVTAEAAASATTITLNNVGDYSVGDKFYVEHQAKEYSDWDTIMPNNANSWYQDIQIRHEITGISGNTLTFTPALPYKVYSGAFAYKANRPITIKGASDDPTDGTCKPYFYAQNNASTRTIDGMTRYRRKMIIKDVQFLGIGNSSSNFQYMPTSGFNDGYWRYSNSQEGIVVDGMGNSNNSYAIRNDQMYYAVLRNFISTNGYRCYYGGREGHTVVNSVGLNGRRLCDNFGVQNVSGKVAYMRVTRCYENFRVYHRSMGMHIGAYQIYGENERYNQCFNGRNNIHQCHLVGRRELIRDLHNECYASYIKFDHIASGTDLRYFYYTGSDRFGYYHTYGGVIYEMNYEIDNEAIFRGFKITYDNKEGAYLAKDSFGNAHYYPAGCWETVQLRPNETIRIKASVKLHPDNPNANYNDRPLFIYHLSGHQSGHRTASRGAPYLNITGSDHLSYDQDYIGDINKKNQNMLFPQVNYGYLGSENYDNSSFVNSFSSRDQFDSKTQFIDRTITITNEHPVTKTLTYGLAAVSADASSYGFYFKDFVIARNQSQTLMGKLGDRFRRLLPVFTTKGDAAVKQKKRFGGARL